MHNLSLIDHLYRQQSHRVLATLIRLLDAHDLNEALRLAGCISPVRFGTIKVRPVRELPPRDEPGQ